MHIELTAPCCLTLAALRLDGQPALLGLTLQHPPVQLLARPSEQLLVSGARADAAYYAAARFLEASGLVGGAEIEIDLAIPSQMGLGSSAIAGLSAAAALAALHGLPADDGAALVRGVGLAADDGLAAHAFGQGGLLAVDIDGRLLRRALLPHSDEASDWVFVLLLPRPPRGTPEELEDTRRRALWAASALIDAEEAARASAALWAAAEARQIAAFGAALMQLQTLGDAALAQLNAAPSRSPADDAALAVMRESGAYAYGLAPTGLGLYALVEGAAATHRLRQALAQLVGHEGGTATASICAPQGATLTK
jgi:predicted sugar kinase